MSTKLSRITELAKEDKQRPFTSIAHLLTVEALYAAFLNLQKEASAGVDGVRHVDYAEDLTRAATITVNTLVDENDGSCLDGDCSLGGQYTIMVP